MVSVIIPIYNGEKYLPELIDAIRKQKVDRPIEIIAAVSKSSDNSKALAEELCDITFDVIDFNHGKTRHQAAELSNGECLVFITQDILPFNDLWLSNLIAPLMEENDICATYSRQVAYPGATYTEQLIREFNYPDHNRLCNNTTIEKWGRKNIFYSDASSATRRDIFFELGGYNFELITNEDVYYALNVIDSGKSIFYNCKSIVYHSHDFNLNENIARYKMIGQFEYTIKDRLINYSSNGEGIKLLKHVVLRLCKQLKFKELFTFICLDVPSRFLAYKIGYKKNKKESV